MVFLEPETPERNWTLIYEISLVQVCPQEEAVVDIPVGWF